MTRETPDLHDECDVRTGVHRGTCALCVGEASPFAEGLLLTHFQHTEDCHANPCSCHFYEDLAVIRVALAATPEPAPCRCEHPFSDHRTPGTECSVIGCDCEPYEPAPAVLDGVGQVAAALLANDFAREGDKDDPGLAGSVKLKPYAAGC